MHREGDTRQAINFLVPIHWNIGRLRSLCTCSWFDKGRLEIATSLDDQLDSPNKSRSGRLYGVKAVEALPGAIRAATLALLCPHA
jgi:hypothetical protein